MVSFETSEGRKEGWLHPREFSRGTGGDPLKLNHKCFVKITGMAGNAGTLFKRTVHNVEEARPRGPNEVGQAAANQRSTVQTTEAWTVMTGLVRGQLIQHNLFSQSWTTSGCGQRRPSMN